MIDDKDLFGSPVIVTVNGAEEEFDKVFGKYGRDLLD